MAEWSYYLHSFLTLALDVGEWLASHPSCLTPRKQHLVCIEQEAWWAPDLVLCCGEKRLLPARNCTAFGLPDCSLPTILTELLWPCITLRSSVTKLNTGTVFSILFFSFLCERQWNQLNGCTREEVLRQFLGTVQLPGVKMFL